MTPARSMHPLRTGTFAARALVALAALLVLNAGWLFFGVTTPAVVEADTGVAAAELAAAYPGVAAELDARGRTIAILLAGVSLMALLAALGQLGNGAVGGRAPLWTFVATLAGLGVHGLTAGNTTVGGLYLVFGLLVAVALASSAPRRTSP